MKTNLFDPIAKSYYSSTPLVPQKYRDLLQKTLQLKARDHIIELGCGSGDLALTLSQKSSFVEGLDSSKIMIDMAKQKDLHKQVTWIHESVDKFDFGKDNYDLIFSYESFHLFPNQRELIKEFASSLKKGGIFCVGWAMYAFDYQLKDSVEEIFNKNGMPWDDWGEWTCPELPHLIKEANVGLSNIRHRKIKVRSQISTEKIIKYLFSVSKTASLDRTLKEKIARELKERLVKFYPSGESIGADEYSIMYWKKD